MRRNRALPHVQSLMQSIERSLTRLITDVKSSEQILKREVDELESQTRCEDVEMGWLITLLHTTPCSQCKRQR